MKTKSKSKALNLDLNTLAIDVEANGAFIKHGCRPFFLSTCNNEGENVSFEFDVVPTTREVIYSKTKLQEFRRVVNSYKYFSFHNAMFDIEMLSVLPFVGDDLLEIFEKAARLGRIDDTMFSSHIIDSKELKGLKEQALIHCGILDDDEKALDDCIKKLRLKAKSLQWAIAGPDIPSLAGQTDKFHKCDMWLPRAWAQHHKLKKSAPEWTLCSTYGDLDTWRTICLRVAHARILNENPQWIEGYRRNLDLIFPLMRMQNTGLGLHKSNFTSEIKETTELAKKHLGKLQSLAAMQGMQDFNPNSPIQLNKLIFGKYELKSVKETKTGNPSTDKEAIPKLLASTKSKQATKFLRELIDYKKVNTVRTYLQSYDRYRLGYKLYPSFGVVGTSTTRFNSYTPNGQNIGKGKELLDSDGLPIVDSNGKAIMQYSIRKVFGPPKGYQWATVDYDQLQLRIFAYWSKEPSLIKAFEDGFDFHTYMAMRIFETDSPTSLQRRRAKNVNFGYIFGAGPAKIDATAGVPGLTARVSKMFPNVSESIAKTVEQIKKKGYVETMGGYRLSVPRYMQYAGVNYIVQGTEGDIVKRAFKKIYDYLEENEFPMELTLQVHDEFILQFEKSLKYKSVLKNIKRIMEESGDYFGVACVAKPDLVTDNWAESTSLAI